MMMIRKKNHTHHHSLQFNMNLHSEFVFKLIVIVIVISSCLLEINQVLGFHLSFGHRIVKSAPTPQLNPASSLIRPIECRNANNRSEVGICMFSIDCMQNKGVPLSVCKHNYFVGTCCRLPDYNNFVGIVYDLRDTETGNSLEARKSSASPSPAIPMISHSQNGQSTEQQSMTTTTTTTPSTSRTAQNHVTSDQQVRLSLDESTKYILSSSSLFPSTAPLLSLVGNTNETGPTSVNADYTASSVAQQRLPTVAEQHVRLASPSMQLLAGNGESARNVDGSIPQIQAASNSPLVEQQNSPGKQQIVVPSELDSFQIQTTLATSSPLHEQHQHQQQQQAFERVSSSSSDLIGYSKPSSATYDLIKDDNLEVLSTINSAHSSPASPNLAINMIEPSEQQTRYPRPPTVDANVDQIKHSSGYMMIEEQQQNKQQQQQNIVFANNHQSQSSQRVEQPIVSSSSVATAGYMNKQPLQSSPISDQEFTLSTVSVATQTGTEEHQLAASSSSFLPQTQTTEIITQQQETQSKILPSSSTTTTTTTLPTSSSTVQHQGDIPSIAGQFTDLISSSSSGHHSFGTQTTTPFTTSLSTALLPNVSSHPYAPTEAPSSALVVQSEKQQPQQSFTDSSQSAHSNSGRPVMLTSAAETTPSLSSSSLSSSSLGQLYSSASGAQYGSSPNAAELVTGRPATHQQTAGTSKIVSSTSGSSSNNLIPGLSGLQSAILSHIPFKLASGLSSGLSSYLQAAMKPNGGRPLISSNTAPALQFQQQTSTTTARPPSYTASPNTFSSGGSIRFPVTPNPTLPTDFSSAVSSNVNGSTSNVLSVSVSPAVLDAHLVCGKPQVTQLLSSAQVPSDSLISGILRRRVGRIVGGNQSMFGQWPWMVSLRQWRKGAFLHKCGAALLNERWAITAAHCVENVKASDLLLRLGEFDVSSQEEPYPYVERRVKQVVSHPSFDSKTFEYDLALLKFAEPVRYERNIVPVCVPSGNDSYVDRMATVIGWGRLYEDGPLPDVIQHVDVPIITNNECEKMYKNAGYIEEIPNMFICAGISKGGRDSCEGDSGGPLTMVDHDGRSYLVGIISWGIGCALPSQPGVYTRITAFSGWINQIIAN